MNGNSRGDGPDEPSASRARFVLNWLATVLMVGGLAAVMLCGWFIAQAYTFQREAKAELAHVISTRLVFHARRHPVQDTDFLGQIDIPRIGLSAIILEGSQDRTLRFGVGHNSGTALPGKPGNIALAGHRDIFFRPLREIHKNDEIRLTTLAASETYRVDWMNVVGPDNTEVLKDGSRPTVTLVTCYPFHFVGPAPKRFVVRAHQASG